APWTTTEAVAVLLAVFVSASLPTTVAVLLIEPLVDAVVTIVIVTDAPFARLPRLQLTTAPPVQVPCELVTETNVIPAGSGSATLTPVAASGPLFVTVSVQVTLLPSVAGFGEPLFVIARSIAGGAGVAGGAAGGAGGAGGGGGGGGGATVLLRFSQMPSDGL